MEEKMLRVKENVILVKAEAFDHILNKVDKNKQVTKEDVFEILKPIKNLLNDIEYTKYTQLMRNTTEDLSIPKGKLDLLLENLKYYQTTIDGNPAWIIEEYMSYMSGRQGLYNIETYVMKDNILYTLKFFSDPLKVPETLPIAQQIIDSFRIVGLCSTQK